MIPFNMFKKDDNFNNIIVYSVILKSFITHIFGKKISIYKLMQEIEKKLDYLENTQLQIIAEMIIKLIKNINNLNNIEEKIIKENDEYIIFTSNNAFLSLIIDEILNIDKLKINEKTKNYYPLSNNILQNDIFRNLMLFLIMGGKFLLIYNKKDNTFWGKKTIFKIDDNENIILLGKFLKSSKIKIKNSEIFPEYKIFLNLHYNKNTIIKNKNARIFLETLHNLILNTQLIDLIGLKNGKIYIKNNYNIETKEIYNKLYFLIYALIKINQFLNTDNIVNLHTESIATIIKDIFSLNKNYDFEKFIHIIHNLKFRCFYCNETFNLIKPILCSGCLKIISKNILNDKNIINFINN